MPEIFLLGDLNDSGNICAKLVEAAVGRIPEYELHILCMTDLTNDARSINIIAKLAAHSEESTEMSEHIHMQVKNDVYFISTQALATSVLDALLSISRYPSHARGISTPYHTAHLMIT